jgi:hypothetical protein
MEKDSRMSSVKLVLTSSAHSINRYKNSKNKILKCCANTYFMWLCLFKCLLVPPICGGNDFEGESSQTECIISSQYVDSKLKKQEIAKVLM